MYTTFARPTFSYTLVATVCVASSLLFASACFNSPASSEPNNSGTGSTSTTTPDGSTDASTSGSSGAVADSSGSAQASTDTAAANTDAADSTSNDTSATASTGIVDECLDAPAGLIAFWSGDAQDGTDGVGGHHASPMGSVGYTDDVADHTTGQAFQFDGAAGYLDASTPPQLALEQGSFTVFARVRLDALTAPIGSPSLETEDASIVSKMAGSNSSGWRLLKQGVAGRFWWCFGETNGTNGCEAGDATLVQSTTTPQVGVWYSVAGVKNGLNIELYVDAESEGDTTMSGFNPAPRAPLLLGAWAGNPGVGVDGYLPGALDDVMLFDRALSADEIADLHALPVCDAG